MQTPILIYDGDCAFCQRCVDLAGRVLPAPVRAEPYQLIELGPLGLTVDQARRRPGGSAPTARGGAGTGRSRRCSVPNRGGGARDCGWFIDHPPVSWIACVGYALVARFRHRLPGGTAQCRVPADPRA